MPAWASWLPLGAFGLDFIPVAREPYDLVLRASTVDDELLAPLWTLLQQADFQAQVESLGGYSCSETGRRIRCTIRANGRQPTIFHFATCCDGRVGIAIRVAGHAK